MTEIEKAATILAVVCEEQQQPVELVRSRSRRHELVKCRQLYAYFCHQLGIGVSQSQMGVLINRDHSSMVHNIRTAHVDIRYNGLAADAQRIKCRLDRDLGPCGIELEQWVLTIGRI